MALNESGVRKSVQSSSVAESVKKRILLVVKC